MKKIIVITALLAAAATLTGGILCFARTNCLSGSGHTMERTVELPAFSQIEVSRGIHVTLIDNGTHTATIKADDNLIDKIFVRVEGEELKITIDSSLPSLRNVSAEVTVPTDGRLSAIKAGSAAQITGDVTLRNPKITIRATSAASIRVKAVAELFDAEATSAADIDADVEAEACGIGATSASKITIRGQAAACNAEITSAAKLRASEFIVENYKIRTTSAGKADIYCTNTIQAEATSGSSITQTGAGAGTTKATSGGSIRKR